MHSVARNHVAAHAAAHAVVREEDHEEDHGEDHVVVHEAGHEADREVPVDVGRDADEVVLAGRMPDWHEVPDHLAVLEEVPAAVHHVLEAGLPDLTMCMININYGLKYF